MKTILTFIILASAIMISSCSSQKAAYSQNQNSNQQRPSRVARTVDPCIELSEASTDNLRAYGTATAYVEKVALNEATRDARNRLAGMIKTAVEGAAQDYERNANTNMETTSATLGEAVMTQFISAEVENTPTIKTSIYDLSDGSVQVYVCIEMRKNKKSINEGVLNVLDEEDVLKTEYDRERFVNKMSEGLEAYKQEQKSRNL